MSNKFVEFEYKQIKCRINISSNNIFNIIKFIYELNKNNDIQNIEDILLNISNITKINHEKIYLYYIQYHYLHKDINYS